MPDPNARKRKTRRTFTKEFNLQVLNEVDTGTSIAEASRIHEIHPETGIGPEIGARDHCGFPPMKADGRVNTNR